VLASRFQHAAELGNTISEKGGSIAKAVFPVKPARTIAPPAAEVQLPEAQRRFALDDEGGV
jgi:hypothetical protein